jgi:hypothetical protein
MITIHKKTKKSDLRVPLKGVFMKTTFFLIFLLLQMGRTKGKEFSGRPWTNEEDQQLTDFFVNYKMDIPKISDIHKREEPEIKERLEILKLIKQENFIKYEIIEFEKDKRNEGFNSGNGLFVLSAILSKHISKINERLDIIETRLRIFSQDT